jgi:hypothetical protein
MEYKAFLKQTGLNEKQIVLLRWISVTVGGVLHIEPKEKSIALKLEKLGLIKLNKDMPKFSASLTNKGKEIIKRLDSTYQEWIIN